MRYFLSMAVFIPILGALVASAASATNLPMDGGRPAGASGVSATRFTGASATAQISVRIIASASIGSGLGPPAPGMVPRRAMVSAADGRPVPALVYDFE